MLVYPNYLDIIAKLLPVFDCSWWVWFSVIKTKFIRNEIWFNLWVFTTQPARWWCCSKLKIKCFLKRSAAEKEIIDW